MRTDPGEFADPLDAERTIGNMHRAHADFHRASSGEPLDVLSIFDQPMTYNDGKILECPA